METVLVKRADHPDGAVLINKTDFVEGKDELFANVDEPVAEPEPEPEPEPVAKLRRVK